MGHEQMLDTCEEQSTSAAGTSVRCTYAFHSFGSRELGLGPFSGSYFDLTVRDGEIVRVTENIEISEFSPQLWEPFSYSWMVANYPADIDVMYVADRNGPRMTEESIQLREQHIREYVDSHAARRNAADPADECGLPKGVRSC